MLIILIGYLIKLNFYSLLELTSFHVLPTIVSIHGSVCSRKHHLEALSYIPEVEIGVERPEKEIS